MHLDRSNLLFLNCNQLGTFKKSLVAATYMRVTGNSNEIPIFNSNNSVRHLTQVNEGKLISFIYTICFYCSFGIHSVIFLSFTKTFNTCINT